MGSWFSRSQARELALIAGPAVVIILAAFWLAFQFVEPAPPSVVTFTSGGEGGGYHAFAKRYAGELENSGLKLEVLTSNGSIDNLQKLGDDTGKVALGFVQGGIATDLRQRGEKLPDVVSLGRVFLEPLWIFHNLRDPPTTLTELRGMRLAVGPPGSGTRSLVETLLKPNGIDETNTDLKPIGGRNAADALEAGEVDVAFLVLAADAPLVKRLLKTPSLKLLDLKRAEAYTRILPYLSRVVLPEGVVDLVGNVPESDINMVAAQAAVVARADTHPAVVALMAEALGSVHRGGGMFQKIDEFPKAVDPEFEIAEDAVRIYREGPTFLKRYLPFWLANFIERMIVMALPIATILIPLVKIVPWVYETRIKSRIFYWFQELRHLEQRMEKRQFQQSEADELRRDIDTIDSAVNNIPIPWHYTDRYYELKAAVDLVRQRIETRVFESLNTGSVGEAVAS